MLTAPINCNSNGANVIIAADAAGRKIRVFGFLLSFSGTVNATFQTQTGSAALTGPIYGVAGSYVISPVLPTPDKQVQPIPHFVTVAGDELILNLSPGVAVGGYVLYDLVVPSL